MRLSSRIMTLILGIILGVVLTVGGVALGGYMLVSGEGTMGKIDDKVEFVEFDEEIRNQSLLQYGSAAIETVSKINEVPIGELEDALGIDVLSSKISEFTGISEETIKDSKIGDLGTTMGNSLTVNNLSDKFGLEFPDSIPLFNDEEFKSKPVSEAFSGIDDETLDKFISITYDADVEKDPTLVASSPILQKLGTTKISELSNSMDGVIDSTKIGEIIDVETEGPNKSSAVLIYLKDVEIQGLNQAIKDMTIGDAIGDTTNAHIVVKRFAGLTLDQMANNDDVKTIIEDLALGEVITINDADEPILVALKDTKVGNLNDRVKELTLKDVFKEYDVGVLSLISPDTLIPNISKEFSSVVANASLYTLRQIGLFKFNEKALADFGGNQILYQEYLQKVRNSAPDNVVKAFASGSFDAIKTNYIHVKLSANADDHTTFVGMNIVKCVDIDTIAQTDTSGNYVITKDVLNTIVANGTSPYQAPVLLLDAGVKISLNGNGGEENDFDSVFSVIATSMDSLVTFGATPINIVNSIGGHMFFMGNTAGTANFNFKQVKSSSTSPAVDNISLSII